MASLDPYDDDEYSDEEEDDWQDQDPGGEGGITGLNKDHQSKNSQITDLVSVSEFQTLCLEKIKSAAEGKYGFKRTVADQTIAKEMGVKTSELKKMQEECDPSKLLPPGGFSDLYKLPMSKVVEETSFKSLKDPKELRFLFHKMPLTYGYDLKARENSELGVMDSVHSGEIILNVVVFHPLTKNRDQEYAVLGSQKLTKLRDRIVCHSDYSITKDFSEDPSSLREYLKNVSIPPNPSPSAFFFINNTFYNDMRSPESTDLSRPIIEWGSVKERLEQSRRLEQFTSGDMAETTFDQLSVRLGYPYLFTHHTDCEHLMQFTDMRLYHPSIDKQSLSEYPRLTHRHRKKIIKCKMCKSLEPVWATFNDELAPCSPCHFCEDCFIKLHYTRNGKKAARFEAYHFHSPSH